MFCYNKRVSLKQKFLIHVYAADVFADISSFGYQMTELKRLD